jgi:hypothetical protein
MSGLNGGVGSTSFAKPLYVRLSVPEFGFGNELEAIVQYYLERGEELRTGCLRTRADHRLWIIFCFRDPQNANDFATSFSGEVVVPAADDFFFLWQGAGLDL